MGLAADASRKNNRSDFCDDVDALEGVSCSSSLDFFYFTRVWRLAAVHPEYGSIRGGLSGLASKYVGYQGRASILFVDAMHLNLVDSQSGTYIISNSSSEATQKMTHHRTRQKSPGSQSSYLRPTPYPRPCQPADVPIE